VHSSACTLSRWQHHVYKFHIRQFENYKCCRRFPNPLLMAQIPSGPRPPHYPGFTITLRHTTLDRTPLDELSARHTDLYRTTHNTVKRQKSMPPAGFGPTIPAIKRPQTDAFRPCVHWDWPCRRNNTDSSRRTCLIINLCILNIKAARISETIPRCQTEDKT